MFEGQASAALALYESVFETFQIENVERYGPGEPGPEGSVKLANASLGGHALMFIDSPITHGFTFTPATSLFVDFESVAELEAAFATLSENGKVFMPIDNYGFSDRFGWCADRFGVSWQLNVP